MTPGLYKPLVDKLNHTENGKNIHTLPFQDWKSSMELSKHQAGKRDVYPADHMPQRGTEEAGEVKPFCRSP